MMDLYPPESQKLNVIDHLEEFRRRILICLFLFLGLSIVFFIYGKGLISVVRQPLDLLHLKLIFISPTEAFTSYLKLSFLFAFIICFPFFLYQAWAFLAPAITSTKKVSVFLWLGLALIFFLFGLSFSFFIAFPSALKYLIFFGESLAEPYITVGKYISFFCSFLLMGGLVFEIPIVLGLLTDIGFIRSDILKRKRQYAILIILIIAAILTPTQDIFNMMIFAIPMVFLYEGGIWVSQFIEKRKDVKDEWKNEIENK